MFDVRYQWPKIHLTFLLLFFAPLTIIAQTNHTDMLAYMVNNFDGKVDLMLYDSASRTSSLLINNIDPDHFRFSKDGHLAFSPNQIGNAEIYLLDALIANSPTQITQTPDANDYPFAWSLDSRYLAFASYKSNQNHAAQLYILDTQTSNSTPINISQIPDADYYSLAWSPDSRYLAFVSHQSSGASIFIWNGKTIVNITPKDANTLTSFYELSWSLNKRLAFTIRDKSDNTEIFLWDGNTTTNLSQNPLGEDVAPAWSSDGKLAFLSERGKEYDILVWDGASYKNGTPDQSTYTNVAHGSTYYESFPRWIENGLLKFVGQTPQDSHVQVFVWDGKMLTNLSQNPTMHNGSATWTNDGRWAFSTFFSPQQLIYVRDQDNHTTFTVEGSQPTWGPDGDLAYCYNSSWTLYVWDGKTISKVTEGREIWAQWLGGEGLNCSSG